MTMTTPRTTPCKKNVYLYFTFECRNHVYLFNTPIDLKTRSGQTCTGIEVAVVLAKLPNMSV